MSNSIWKMQDVKPDIDKQILVINDFGYVIYFGKYAVAPENKWCYVDDLIAQADKAKRLQKAVDLAVGALEEIAKREDNDVFFSNKTTAEEALKKIQQKD